MIPTDLDVKKKYIELLPGDFFNPKLPEVFRAPSGLTIQKDLDIDKFSNGIFRAFDSMTKGMKASGVAVAGGGGAPGKWTGGLGTGGKLTFTFDMTIPDAYEAAMLKVKNTLLSSAIKDAVTEALGSYTFTALKFGDGTSTHTAQSPGTLTESKCVKDKLSKVGKVSMTTKLDSLDEALNADLSNNGFKLTDFLKNENSSIKKLVKYLFNYYLDNTEASDIKAAGGVTLASAGTLSGGVASGGSFK